MEETVDEIPAMPIEDDKNTVAVSQKAHEQSRTAADGFRTNSREMYSPESFGSESKMQFEDDFTPELPQINAHEQLGTGAGGIRYNGREKFSLKTGFRTNSNHLQKSNTRHTFSIPHRIQDHQRSNVFENRGRYFASLAYNAKLNQAMNGVDQHDGVDDFMYSLYNDR